MFIDADDFISNDMIETMVDIANNTNSEIVYCDYYKYYDGEKSSYEYLVPINLQKYNHCEIMSMPGPTCKLISKELIDRVNFKFPENIIFEDNAVIPFLFAKSNKNSYLKDAKYFYLQREGSSLNNKDYSKKFEDIFESLEILYNLFDKDELLPRYNNELEYVFIEYLIHAAGLKFLKYDEGIPNLNRIHDVMYKKFPNWKKNKYFKDMSLKYQIVCKLIYNKKVSLLKIILRSN